MESGSNAQQRGKKITKETSVSWPARQSTNLVSGDSVAGKIICTNKCFYPWKQFSRVARTMYCICRSKFCRYPNISQEMIVLPQKISILQIKYFHASTKIMSMNSSTTKRIEFLLKHKETITRYFLDLLSVTSLQHLFSKSKQRNNLEETRHMLLEKRPTSVTISNVLHFAYFFVQVFFVQTS
jgi:hypothetical protein